MKRSLLFSLAVGALLASIALWASACATGTSAVAASTHGKASVYRSATAYIRLTPDRAFKPAVEMLLERGDIEITDLKEANNRCKAVAGDRKLTFRVIESTEERSRLSLLVGGGDDPVANQELADRLMQQICGRLGVACDFGVDDP
jgi:hypothetical protein